MFWGKHKKFDMAEDTVEEGRNSQNFCSTELGYVLAVTTTTTTASIKTTMKELVYYNIHSRLDLNFYQWTHFL